MSEQDAESPTVATSEKIGFLRLDLKEEYYKIVDIVSGFDQRLLTVKGWGVTFSLATAALAFQQNHYGLFLIAAASALAFWIVEASVKRHQMRYYPRMGDIEEAAYRYYLELDPESPMSAPMIDWSWYTSGPRIRGGKSKGDPRRPARWADVAEKPGLYVMLFPHVAFPHVIVLVLGATFFILGLVGMLGPL